MGIPHFGSYVQLQSGIPTFYSVSRGSGYSLEVYAADKDGVYQDITSRATLTSSNPGVANPMPPSSSFAFTSVAMAGTNGQATITATYNGLTSSMTIAASTAPRPCPAVGSNISLIGANDFVSTSSYVDSPDCRLGVVSLLPSQIEWSTSDPSVVSVSGSTLRTVGPGSADITLRYNGLQTVYRIFVPPWARLSLVQ